MAGGVRLLTDTWGELRELKKSYGGQIAADQRLADLCTRCVLVSFYREVEQRLREEMERRVDRHASKTGARWVAERESLVSFLCTRHFKVKDISGCLGKINKSFQAKFEQACSPYEPDYSSMLTNRHSVAHATGNARSVTFNDLTRTIRSCDNLVYEAVKLIRS